MRFAGITDIGLHRKRNEDYYFVDENRAVFVVCDGMGGHKGGDVASRLAVETIRNNLFFTKSDEIIPTLDCAIRLANDSIYNKGRSDETLFEMGTTLTAAVIYDGNMTIAHVGDSSLYLYHAGILKKITQDHTLAEQMLTDGLLKQEDMQSNGYNHVLTRAVGIETQVEIDFYQEEIIDGDWVLMCTDGLTDLITDDEICEHLKAAAEPEETARVLMDLALGKGGYDNITIVLLCV